MLVITRKAGQWVEIGPNIKVHIFGINGGQVKVGINAPKEIDILRGELIPDADYENGYNRERD